MDTTPLALLPALRTHHWFATCPAAFQLAVVERSRLLHLKAGDTLFKPGDASDELSCMVAGAIKLCSMSTIDGQPRLMMYLEPYNWFGEIGLIDRMPHATLAVADTDCTVLITPREALEAWLDEHPQHWRDVARLASGKMRLMLAAHEDKATLTLQQRTARRLAFAAASFGQVTIEKGLRRRLRMPQQYLAQMLGVSRQTVNKVLRELEREQVLALHYAEIEITDLAGLIAKAGPVDPSLLQLLSAPP